MAALRRAVFLDRDGVLNKSVVRDGVTYPPHTLDEVEILPGVEAAMQQLTSLGFLLVVATNQPDVARGKQKKEVVEAINAYLRERLPIDEIRCCYHDNADHCLCRKPKPGMLRDAAAHLGIALKASFMVGDRWSDVSAGAAAGCRTVLIDNPYSHGERCCPDHVARDLPQAVDWIASQPAVPV